jgi:hypothetical protein
MERLMKITSVRRSSGRCPMSGYGYSLHTLKEWTTRSVLSLDTGSAALRGKLAGHQPIRGTRISLE